MTCTRCGSKDHSVSRCPWPSERQIEAHLVKRVVEMGGEVRKVQFLDRRGAPDRLVMFPHHVERFGRWGACRTIWIELKAPGKPLKSWQQREHQRLKAAGQVVLKIDSVAQVDEVLR